MISFDLLFVTCISVFCMILIFLAGALWPHTTSGAPQGGSGAMCYVQNSLACYALCKFLFTLLCEIKIGCYVEV